MLSAGFFSERKTWIAYNFELSPLSLHASHGCLIYTYRKDYHRKLSLVNLK